MRRLILAGGLIAAVSLVSVRPVTTAAPAATFNKAVAPILLITYQDARPYARAIKEKVVARAMPPWFADPHFGTFANDVSLTRKEIDIIAAWGGGGAPPGGGQGKPEPPPAPQTR